MKGNNWFLGEICFLFFFQNEVTVLSETGEIRLEQLKRFILQSRHTAGGVLVGLYLVDYKW